MWPAALHHRPLRFPAGFAPGLQGVLAAGSGQAGAGFIALGLATPVGGVAGHHDHVAALAGGGFCTRGGGLAAP